ncbi:DUF898 family protein, partial [Klebsiella pneumoniae]
KNTRFGTAQFDFSGTPGNFYGVYLRTFGLAILALVVASCLALLLGVSLHRAPGVGQIFGFILIGLFMYAAMLFLTPYFLSRLQNVVWN